MAMEELGDAPATRSDMRVLAKMIGDVRRGLAVVIVRNAARVDLLEEWIDAKLQSSESRILNGMDAFASRTEKVDRAQVIVDYRLTELEKRVASIEPHPS